MKKKTTIETDRTNALAEARKILSEHYDCGFCIVTWEQGGETMSGEFKFGNKYAIDGLVSDSFSILFPEAEKEEAEDA